MSRFICGLQPVREAIRARGGELEKVLVERGSGDDAQFDALARFAGDHGVTVERVARVELDRLSRGARHQGAVAFAPELRLVSINDVGTGPDALVVALDELQDPQNFGAIVRSCVALGASAVVWPENRSAPLSAAMFRASAGAVEHAILCRVPSLNEALATLKAGGLTVVGLDMNGKDTIAAVPLTGGVVLVVGAEGKGLRKPVKQACDHLARLPMHATIASLNASVAAGIALYEVARQRASSGGDRSPVESSGGDRSPVESSGGDRSPVESSGGDRSPVESSGGDRSSVESPASSAPDTPETSTG